jgi:hypothetical protein
MEVPTIGWNVWVRYGLDCPVDRVATVEKLSL